MALTNTQRIAWRITDEHTVYLLELRNGALHHRTVSNVPDGVTTFELTRRVLVALVVGARDLSAALADGTVRVDGDPGVLGRLVELLAPVDPAFDIVTP